MAINLRKEISRYPPEIVSIVLLFPLALSIKLLYRHESVVDNPIRAEAGKYLGASYNLRWFGVYSKDKREMSLCMIVEG